MSTNEFQVGDWVTAEASNGWKLKGQITAKEITRDKITYTVKQFPDALLDLFERNTT